MKLGRNDIFRDYPKGPAHCIDKLDDGRYQLFGIGHGENGGDVIYHTGTLDECKERFYNSTKYYKNIDRRLYVIDEVVRYILET